MTLYARSFVADGIHFEDGDEFWWGVLGQYDILLCDEQFGAPRTTISIVPFGVASDDIRDPVRVVEWTDKPATSPQSRARRAIDWIVSVTTDTTRALRLAGRRLELSPGWTPRSMGAKGGRTGGRVRAERLSPERRSEIARQAAKARWDAR